MDLTNLENIITGLKSFNAHDEVLLIVENNSQKLSDLQREQMLKGRGVDGEYIRPFYSENPYFKKPGAALKYAQWKQKITPNAERPEDVPNLTINNRFHDSIYTKLSGDTFSMESDDSNADDIISVHQNAIGLDADSRLQFATEITLPEFAKVFEEKTTLRM